MKDMELLAPAGNMESLKMAVYNGANAVYLGINQFNARNNIDGFTLDNIADAVEFAHLYGVKVYVALNILFKDDELQSVLDLVMQANNVGVDAFIIQDMGLAYLINKFYPSIELHASTQMAVHNLEGVKILEKLGFKRVVLARETSPEEIKRIRDGSDIEIEFFVQGALCVSFSGNCYMCSHLVNKSGNRGVCQQFCRLPYTFESGSVSKHGFLLSAKDISLLDSLQQLKGLGVTSLKIEGRARRPYYVLQACRIYRDMLDNSTYSPQDFDRLKLAFNRDYTPAYFNGNGNIISHVQGNNGLYIGEVKKINKGKKFNEIFITSSYELKGKCGLKFIYKGDEIASIGAYDIKLIDGMYKITTTSNINAGSKVYIIQDELLEQEVCSFVRRLPISIDFYAKPNQAIKVSAKYNDIQVTIEGDIAQPAKTISVKKEQILKQLSRSDVFEIDKFNCCVEGSYILNSAINKLRNDIYEKLKKKIIEKYQKITLNKIIIEENNILSYNYLNKFNNIANKSTNNLFNFKIINNIDGMEVCDNLIFNYSNFNMEDILTFNKFCIDHKIKGYIDLPNFATIKDIELIKMALSKTGLGVVANNLYALNFDVDMIGGQFLNVYNSYTLHALKGLHSFNAVFVEELTKQDIMKLQTDLPITKREPVYMTLIHCPYKQNLKYDCGNCKYAEGSFTINSGKKFKICRKKTVSCVFLLKD